MQNNGQDILWRHIRDLLDKIRSIAAPSHGLTLAHRLKQEHINLLSYSRMRVDLAAQVCLFTQYSGSCMSMVAFS